DLHSAPVYFLPGSIVARDGVQSACEGSWILPRLTFGFRSRGRNEWIEPVCVVCEWPLLTSASALLLCRPELPWQLVPDSIQLRLCVPKGKARSLLGFLSPQSCLGFLFTHTTTYFFFILSAFSVSFLFLFFFSFFFSF